MSHTLGSPCPPDAPSTPARRFERLVARHGPKLSRFVRFLGCPPSDVDDLLQDVFVVLVERGFEERSEPETTAFLRETARRLGAARSRAMRRTCQAAPELLEQSFDECESVRDARLEALEHCLAGLGSRQRQLLDAFYGEGQSQRAIAARMGLRVSGLKTLLLRTREQLRTCVARRLELGAE